MAHSIVPEAEEILDKEYKILDKGFIRLVDYMGSDDRIVQSARVSYGKGTKSFRQDKGLINYLLRNEHTSPFEQVSFTFHAKMPVFVARQWVRHRTAKLNEISGRYSVMKNEFYVPFPEDIAYQSSDNKQGRSETVMDDSVKQEIINNITENQNHAYEEYTNLIDKNVAKELARINLPLSLYTEWYWKIDLHNLFHFLKLRMDHHAQYEIRVYADKIFWLVKKVCPLACEAFEEHILNSIKFSGREKAALDRMLAGEDSGLEGRDLEIFKAKVRGIQI